MQTEWLVIVNPNAGLHKGRKDWSLIRKLLEENNIKFDSIFTEQKYHAIELAKTGVEEGYRKIIAVGGDGTLNEVANGILMQNAVSPSDVKLGMITVGTGNDWAKMYKIPNKYKQSIEVVKKEVTKLQDVGVVTYYNDNIKAERFFVNMAGMGFDAQVAMKTNKQKEKGKGNPLSYLLNIFSTLFSHREKTFEIIIDSESFKAEVFSMNVGICRYNGGGMMQTPNAIPDDGLLDLTVIRKVSRLYVVRNVKKLYDGSFLKLPEVSSYTGKEIRITGPKKIFLEVDGESLGHSPFEFGIVKKAISVIVP